MEPRAKAFAGRAAELGTLEQALAAARAGRGAAILVAGEAGIGKTRLAAEITGRAREAGWQTLLGRSIDLVGTELPYQPFAEALRPIGGPRPAASSAGSQLQVFEETLALLTRHASATPVLLVLEDLHWADTSTLNLVVFLAHHLAERPVVLLATYRQGEPSSKGRMARLADGVRRSGSGLVLDLGPLPPEDLAALLATASAAALTPALADAIVARSGGNPFFAEELLAAGGNATAGLPHRLRDLLLQRVERLDPAAQDLLRLVAAAGRDVGYPLLRALAALPEPDVRGALRQAVEHEVLVADQAAGTFRFRHPLLAEAVYSTILPGEREELHARLAGELSRTAAASPAELAPHWAAAGRAAEALTASVEAARQAEAVFGLAEAVGHLERALALWPDVPRRGRLDRARPGRALLLGGRTRQPDRRLAPCGRTRPARHRARRGPGPGRCRPAARAPRGVPVRERQQRRRAGRLAHRRPAADRRPRLRGHPAGRQVRALPRRARRAGAGPAIR